MGLRTEPLGMQAERINVNKSKMSGSQISPSETPSSKTHPSQTANPPSPGATTETATSPPALTTAGWKTYTSESLQVAVDCPPDWNVTEEAGGIAFYFILSGKQGTQRIVTLTVDRGGDMPVFGAMVASLQPLSS